MGPLFLLCLRGIISGNMLKRFFWCIFYPRRLNFSGCTRQLHRADAVYIVESEFNFQQHHLSRDVITCLVLSHLHRLIVYNSSHVQASPKNVSLA